MQLARARRLATDPAFRREWRELRRLSRLAPYTAGSTRVAGPDVRFTHPQAFVAQYRAMFHERMYAAALGPATVVEPGVYGARRDSRRSSRHSRRKVGSVASRRARATRGATVSSMSDQRGRPGGPCGAGAEDTRQRSRPASVPATSAARERSRPLVTATDVETNGSGRNHCL